MRGLLIAVLLSAATFAQNADERREYLAFLETLDATKASSTLLAVDKYVTLATAATDEVRAAMFVDFWNHYQTVLRNGAIIDYNDTEATDAVLAYLTGQENPRGEELTREIERNGYAALTVEGVDVYVDRDAQWIIDKCGAVLPAAIRGWLEILAYEDEHPLYVEAYYLLGNAEALMAQYSEFFERRPDFILRDEAYVAYLSAQIAYFSNYDMYDMDYGLMKFDETGTLTDEAKTMYENFVAANPDNEAGKIVAEYYGLLEQNNFQYEGEPAKYVDAIVEEYASYVDY